MRVTIRDGDMEVWINPQHISSVINRYGRAIIFMVGRGDDDSGIHTDQKFEEIVSQLEVPIVGQKPLKDK